MSTVDPTLSLAERLQSDLGEPIKLFFVDKGDRRIKTRRAENGVLEIECDIIFKDISDRDWQTVIDYLKSKGRKAQRRVVALLRKVYMQKNGFHDIQIDLDSCLLPLQKKMEEYSKAFFMHCPPLTLRWLKPSFFKSQNVQIGKFQSRSASIGFHPVLKEVPPFYQHYVLYHELIHAELYFSGHSAPQLHGRAFAQLEEKFESIDEALDYERNGLKETLESWRKAVTKN